MQDQGGPQTWHDCFKCSHMFFNRTHCLHQPPPRPFNGCKPDVLNYVQVSNYAAQIAWWLAFYPPEQILIITSSELRDPGRQVNVRTHPCMLIAVQQNDNGVGTVMPLAIDRALLCGTQRVGARVAQCAARKHAEVPPPG